MFLGHISGMLGKGGGIEQLNMLNVQNPPPPKFFAYLACILVI